MQDARIRLALAALGLLALGCGGFGLYHSRNAGTPAVVITPPQAAPAVSTPAVSTSVPTAGTPAPAPHRSSPRRLYIHVAGAVRRPWLYALPPGSRVMQAVLAAGGPAPDADLDAVNLAEPVQDGEKVYIPTKHEEAAQTIPSVPPGNTLGNVSVMPKPITPPASAPPVMPTVIEPGVVPVTPTLVVKSGKGKKGRLGKPDKITSPDQGQVALNSADASDLQRLPDVGPAMAARILAFRTQAHGFQSIDELQEVPGIGPKKYAKIAPLVTLN